MRGRWLSRVRGALVLAFWVAMMVLLAQRERAARQPRDAPPVEWTAEASASPAETGGGREEWMGVYLNGAKLGYAVSRTEPLDAGYRIRGRSHLRLPLQGQVRTVETTSSVAIDARHRLRTLDFRLRSDVQNLRVQGKAEPGKLLLEIDTGGTRSQRTVPLTKPIVIPDAMTPILARSGRLRPNTAHTLEIFDPVALAPASATILIGEEESIEGDKGPLRALRCEMTYRGFRTIAWVTPEGETLREESPMGWTMVRQSRESALREPPGQPTEDLVYSAAVPANVPVRNPRFVRFLRVELTGADLSTLSLATERQRQETAESGLLEVRSERVDTGKAPSLPISAPAMALYLSPETLIQSDDPAIVDAARAAAGGERNAWRAAVSIGRWVHDSVEKSPAISVPSALDVLRTRKGDCNEHTALFVALARAAGIPAEACAGIVYVNDSFFYHAWPRVWVGQWVSMDPTFGQEIADATHIELVRGGLDRQAEILRLVGKLRVRIIKAE
ncbi:MAG: transglutaminase domain-containing protein [Armatimonadetes bacterium]|nr:transglutaminase domain-containing protein [Armatimonadota bacterium]